MIPFENSKSTINMIFKETVWRGRVDSAGLGYIPVVGRCEHFNGLVVSIRDFEFLYEFSDWMILWDPLVFGASELCTCWRFKEHRLRKFVN
jgi:hypothetical protein